VYANIFIFIITNTIIITIIIFYNATMHGAQVLYDLVISFNKRHIAECLRINSAIVDTFAN